MDTSLSSQDPSAVKASRIQQRARGCRTALAAGVAGLVSIALLAGPSAAVAAGPQPAAAAASTQDGPRLLVWDGNGVVIRHDGRTRVTSRPTLAAVGDDDAVAYETDPVGGREPARIRVWTPSSDRVVGVPRVVRRQHLAGGGVIEGREVALVDERVQRRGREAATRLVAVDLAAVAAGERDARTRVVAGIRAPGRFTAAAALPDGDVVALRRSRGATWLHRFSTDRPHRVWSRTVARDGERVSLAAEGLRVLLAEAVLRDDGWQQRLRRIDTADGSERGRRIVRTDAPEPAACYDVVGPRSLLCAGEHGAYRLLVAGPRSGEATPVRGSLGRGVGVLGL